MAGEEAALRRNPAGLLKGIFEVWWDGGFRLKAVDRMYSRAKAGAREF